MIPDCKCIHSAKTVNQFFLTGLREIAKDGTVESLLPTVLKVGEVNLTCMAMLDAANTGTYGTPIPVSVPLVVERGPFIVVTGHDLKDLELLLKQTEGKGVNIYTHGEMLPAHAYPELRKYPQLKGNFGTAWQNQQKEFADIPAPILFTTNCLMPPKKSYADRVFTTEVVAYPGMVHIDDEKDFTPVIEKALELGGYQEDRQFTGINGGTQVMTGFGHGTILSMADQVIDAVKSGAIRHFFLVAGCDGAKPGRNYYTDFVKQTPADSLVLTLACGKFRFNDLDLGNIGGLPRIMDMGQCNDAYSAIQVAVALAEAFDCGVNDLPLSMVLSWYEQKAVCILLTLLYLGIRNIKLGPTLPAFVSPGVLDVLVENYGIAPITTPEADLKVLLRTYGQMLKESMPEIYEAGYTELVQKNQQVPEQPDTAPGDTSRERSTTPEFEDAFALYVLADRPMDAPGIWQECVRYFDQFGELNTYRSAVRIALGLQTEE